MDSEEEREREEERDRNGVIFIPVFREWLVPTRCAA
jgi:hypothetical protein